MVRVRPPTLAAQPSNQPPKCYGIWACPTSPPRRTPDRGARWAHAPKSSPSTPGYPGLAGPALELSPPRRGIDLLIKVTFFGTEKRKVRLCCEARAPPHPPAPGLFPAPAFPPERGLHPSVARPTIWISVRRGELPHSITLWWLVRVRPAPPSRLQPENPGFCLNRVSESISAARPSCSGVAPTWEAEQPIFSGGSADGTNRHHSRTLC